MLLVPMNLFDLAMTSAKFRPPLLRKPEILDEDDDAGFAEQPPAKRRRVGSSGDELKATNSIAPKLVFKTPGVSSLPRKPLLDVKNSALAAQATLPSDSGVESCYNVLWCVYSTSATTTETCLLTPRQAKTL